MRGIIGKFHHGALCPELTSFRVFSFGDLGNAFPSSLMRIWLWKLGALGYRDSVF
jgi:hypothetical protein